MLNGLLVLSKLKKVRMKEVLSAAPKIIQEHYGAVQVVMIHKEAGKALNIVIIVVNIAMMERGASAGKKDMIEAVAERGTEKSIPTEMIIVDL